jgi:hypothetical protein
MLWLLSLILVWSSEEKFELKVVIGSLHCAAVVL